MLFLLWNIDEIKSSDDDLNPGSKQTEHDLSDSDSDQNNSCVYLVSDDEAISNCSVSNNTVIIISADIVLSSKVKFEQVNNVTIIGQGNPTVNCNDIGSMKFVSCNNVTIEGVSWRFC